MIPSKLYETQIFSRFSSFEQKSTYFEKGDGGGNELPPVREIT